MDSMVTLDTSGVFAELELFANRLQAPLIRVGSAAAAKVFYDEARTRCTLPSGARGPFPVKSGLLQSSIYRVHSTDKSKPEQGLDVYHISWNMRKAPHGHFLEFGTSKMAARPFLRPAYEAKKAEAIAAGIEAMRQDLQNER